MKWLKSLLGKNPIDSIFEGIDKLSTSKEEKELLRHEAIKLELEAQKLKIGDKDSARAMYAKDSSLQKIFAIIFLVSYIGLSFYILHLFANGEFGTISSYEAGFISSIFTAMSTKVNTVCDFLFGGSQSEKDYKALRNERPAKGN